MAKTRTVYSTQDDGVGTLRDALRVTASYTQEWIDAGALADGDIIDFSDTIEDSQTGVITIYLESQLTLPANTLTIDGGETWTENGVLKTRVILDGQNARRVASSTQNSSSRPTFYGVTFYNGAVENGNGGGFSVSTSSIVIFNNCVFSNNSATRGAGLNSSGNFTCINCYFLNNSATNNGGGIYTTGSSVATLENCTFDSCSANYGGGINSINTSQNTLTDCTFDGCSARSLGGGLLSDNSSQNTLTDCTFESCSAGTNGGGLRSTSTSQNTLTDCTFNECTVTNYGGGLYSDTTSQNTLIDCTFESCSAGITGGDLYSINTSRNSLTNCVFIPPVNYTKPTIYNSGTNTDGSLIINGAATCDIVQFGTNATTVINGELTAETLTIGNGASVTFSGVDAVLAVTNTATIGSATFTAAADSTGYAAFPTGTNISFATFTGVKNCAYGAGIESASLSKTTVSWTATNLSTDILIEQKNGDSWTTLTNAGTGGSYSGTFGEGTTVRLFDGVAFWYASTQFPYWVVNSFAVTNNDWIVTTYAISTNGGGGTDPVTGDPLPSWTVNTADITPNFKVI